MPPPDPIPARLRAIRLLYPVIVVVALVTVWSSLADVALYDREAGGERVPVEDYEDADARDSAVYLIGLVAYIAGAIVFIRWLLPVYRYLDVVAPGVRRFGPHWAIWGWLIPILWYWRPKQVVNDVWRAGGGSVPTLLLTVWWALFVVTNALSLFAGLVFGESATGLRDESYAYALSSALDVPGALLAILIATRASAALGGAAPRGERLLAAK